MDLTTYIKQEDQENYHESINQTLRAALSDNGWTVPNQTSANILLVVDDMPIGTIWFDTTLSKLVVKTANPAVTQVIQSI